MHSNIGQGSGRGVAEAMLNLQKDSSSSIAVQSPSTMLLSNPLLMEVFSRCLRMASMVWVGAESVFMPAFSTSVATHSCEEQNTNMAVARLVQKQ